MDLAITGDRGLGRGLKFGLEGYVRADAVDVGVGLFQPLHRPGEGALFDIAEHHLHPGLGQGGGDPKPYARGRAGDERGLTSLFLHVPLLRSFC